MSEETRAKRIVSPGTAKPTLVTPRLALVLLAQFCFGYAFSSFLLFPKFLAMEFDASAAEIGFVDAGNRAVAMVGLFLCGVAVDRYGRRMFLTLGALLMAAASFGFVFVDQLGVWVYSLRAAQGLAFAMTFTAGAALVVDLSPPGRLAQAIGYFGLTMLSMNAVAPTVVEFLSEDVGWKAAFSLAAVGALLCAAVSLLIRDPERSLPSHERVPGLLEVARKPEQIRSAIVIGIVGAAFASVFVFHQPFAIELGMGKLRGFFIAYTLVAMTVRLGFGDIADRLGRHRVARWSLALYATAVTAMVGLEWIGLPVLGATLGLAHGFFYPSYNAVAVEGAGEHERGKIMAIFQGWFSAGGTLGILGLGLLANVAGYPVVFLVAGCVTFLALAILFIAPRESGFVATDRNSVLREERR